MKKLVALRFQLSNQIRLVTNLRNEVRTQETLDSIALHERIIDKLREDLRLTEHQYGLEQRERHSRLLALVNKAESESEECK